MTDPKKIDKPNPAPPAHLFVINRTAGVRCLQIPTEEGKDAAGRPLLGYRQLVLFPGFNLVETTAWETFRERATPARMRELVEVTSIASLDEPTIIAAARSSGDSRALREVLAHEERGPARRRVIEILERAIRESVATSGGSVRARSLQSAHTPKIGGA